MSLGGGGTDNRELEVGVATPDRSLSTADTNMLMQKQTSKVINGVHTEVVLQPFADRVLILITQLGKVGNLVRGRKLLTAQTNTDSCVKIQASIPPTAPLLAQPSPDTEEPNISTLPPPPPSIQLTPLLGSAPTDHLRTLYTLYASQVATMIWVAEASGAMDERRCSVILGLALKKSGGEEDQGLSEAERETFHQVMGMVGDLVKG